MLRSRKNSVDFLDVYRRIKVRDHHSEKQGIGHLT